MTITIREGRYYWRRDGVREGPMERTASHPYPWRARIVEGSHVQRFVRNVEPAMQPQEAPHD